MVIHLAKKKQQKTNAARILDRLGIDYELKEYEVDESDLSAVHVAASVGMPIEQVQRLLGHVRIDTTLHYAIVNQNNVKMAHKKYLG